ncbi:MAG: YfhO family protein [Anaerolineales bacterium]
MGTLFAMGRYGSVYRVLYDYVPTFDAFREPVRWMIWPVFALAVLAGIGAQNWGRNPRVLYWSRLAVAGGIALVLLGLVSNAALTSDDMFVPVLTTSIAATGAWVAGSALLTLLQPPEGASVSPIRWQMAVVLFVSINLAWAIQGLNPTIPRAYYRDVSMSTHQERLYWFEDYEDEIVFDRYFDLADYQVATRNWPSLRRSVLPNMNMIDNIAAFNNFDPLVPRYYAEYVQMLEAAREDGGPLLEAAGIGQVYGDVQPAGWQPVPGDLTMYQAPDPPPLVWLVPDAVWAENDAQMRDLMRDPAWDPGQTVILHGDEPGLALPAPNATAPFEPLSDVVYFETLRETPDYRSYRIVTEGSGYLVLATTWYPGWQVRVDGRSVELHRANMNFMAVQLPPDGAEVTFQYLPTVNLLSVLVSVLALGGALGGVVIGALVSESPPILNP